jgi:hypothetical protein
MALLGVELILTHGLTKIDLVNGIMRNLDTGKTTTFKELGYASGRERGIHHVRSLFIFSDIDYVVDIGGARTSFNCAIMDFARVLENLSGIEEITVILEDTFAPDKNRLIIIASGEPLMAYYPAHIRPHLFYSNSVTANNADYQDLLYRHTPFDSTVIKVFNDNVNAKDVWVDIQHRENLSTDTTDSWVSYSGYPTQLPAGDTLVFGDDATRNTRHHYHRVRVKTVNAGEQSSVKGSIYGV